MSISAMVFHTVQCLWFLLQWTIAVNMFELCCKYVSTMSQIYLNHFWNMFELFLYYAWSFSPPGDSTWQSQCKWEESMSIYWQPSLAKTVAVNVFLLCLQSVFLSLICSNDWCRRQATVTPPTAIRLSHLSLLPRGQALWVVGWVIREDSPHPSPLFHR